MARKTKIVLTPEKQAEILKYLRSVIPVAVSERNRLIDLELPEAWSRYRGDYSSKKDKNFPWEDSADFHVPFTSWASVSTEARILNAEFGSTEVALLVPTKPEHEEPVKRIQKYLDYELIKRMDFEDVEREGVQRQVVEGTRVDKVVWQKDKRILRKYKLNKKLKEYVVDFVEEVVNGVKKILTDKKIKIEKNEKTVYEGNKNFVIPLDRFIWWGGNDVQTCDGVAEKLYLSIRQIIDKGKTDDWFNIDKLRKRHTTDSQGITHEEKREYAGLLETSNLLNSYTPWEVWCFYDIDGDGNVENCQFVVDLENNVLLYYDENDNFWGTRPYFTTPLFYMSGIPLGQGMPKRLAISNDELDTLHNQVIDNSTVINSMTTTHIPKLLSKNIDRLKLKPGKSISVKSHDAIKPLELARLAIDLGYQEGYVKDILERLAIVTDNSLGRDSANVERPTVRGKAMNLQEFAANFDIILRSVRTGLKKRIRHMLRNTYQYMPKDGIEFPVLDGKGNFARTPKITAEDGTTSGGELIRERVTRQDFEIIDEIDIIVLADAIRAIKGLEQQNAMLMYETLYPQAEKTGELSTRELAEFVVKSVDKSAVDKVMRSPQELREMQKSFEKISQMQQELDQKSQALTGIELELMKRERALSGKETEK